jgi:hypothetical protein
VIAFLSGFLSSAVAQPAAKPAIPVDPTTTIIDREQLYCDARFQAVVNDIVVESGNSRHQAIMDRYIAGEFRARCKAMLEAEN